MIQSCVLRSLVAALALTLLAGCGTNNATKTTVAHVRTTPPTPLSEQARSDIQFGTIKSITRFGPGYRLLFDLGIILSGPTGVQACVENGQCPKLMRHDTGFPDDIASADLHFVLPYYLPPNARIALNGNGAGYRMCSARELYLLAHGRDPRHLAESSGVGPKLSYAFGWWIKVARGNYPPKAPLDSVIRVEEQYHP